MHHLAELKRYLNQQMPRLTDDKVHLFIVNGGYVNQRLEYTARLLFLDCRHDPIFILNHIKLWLEKHHRHLKLNGSEIEINFSSEVIDTNTFDLEIDFIQYDDLNINADTGEYVICDNTAHLKMLGL